MSPPATRAPAPELARPRGERRAVALAAAVQFVVMLDFAVVLPLAPDLVEPLEIPASSLGLLVAVYTGAAALSGLAVSRVLDRFDRRRALLVTVLGLAVAAASGALAPSFAVLLCARTLAGICGAPTHALLMSLIADEVPTERRGAALGVVLGSNAIAAVIGVPTCLWLSGWIGWWMAFVVVGVAGVTVAIAVALSVRARPHTSRSPAPVVPKPARQTSVDHRQLRRAHLLVFIAFGSAFALTPNLSAYVQFNLGYPRAAIPTLYMIAGACAFVVIRVTGVAVDRLGAFAVGSVAIIGLAATVFAFLGFPAPLIPVELAFVALLALLGARNVALRTLTTRVPGPETRGHFMSLQSTAQQLGAVAGALLGMVALHDQGNGQLAGMQNLALWSIGACLLVPALLWLIERALASD